MIDIGITKLAVLGGIALLVLGPEKLPRVARTLGTLLGRVQRYAADVKAEVSRSMALEELKKMKSQMQDAAHGFNQALQTHAADFEKAWIPGSSAPNHPIYQRPKKNWRLKQTALPRWYKARAGVRSKALSGAARVARFRPRGAL